jgi:hypothetical protein
LDGLFAPDNGEALCRRCNESLECSLGSRREGDNLPSARPANTMTYLPFVDLNASE